MRSVLMTAVLTMLLASGPVRAGPLGALGAIVQSRVNDAASRAVDKLLHSEASRDEAASNDSDSQTESATAASADQRKALPSPMLKPTKGWEFTGPDQARVVNVRGESYVITRVVNGYTFELTIPSATPGELNHWTPNVQVNTKNTDPSVDVMHLAPYIEFNRLIPLEYQAITCRTRDLEPDEDACVAKRERKVDNTIFLWVPTLKQMPALQQIFDLLARGRLIKVDYLFPSERRSADFVTVGGADIRRLLTQ